MFNHGRKASPLGKLSFSGSMLGMLLCGANAIQAQTYNNTIFGPNVYVFDPSINGSALATALNGLNQEAEFSTKRYAVLFKPGSYNFGTTTSGTTTGPLQIISEGFYESIAGLGTTPDQVSFAGNFDVGMGGAQNGTDNFWRSQENMEVSPNGNGYWGVAQGASYRRMHVNGNLQLTDYQCGWSSGGFISNTYVSGTLSSCSEQQYYVRNTQMGAWTGSNWNMVFSGDTGNPPTQNFGNGGSSWTVLKTTPTSREKPFLYLDGSGNYNVFIPAVKTNSSGYDWAGGLGSGASLAISTFFIATPTSSLTAINNALAAGQNLILTPGIYNLSGTIKVPKANSVVLGLGYATLIPQGAFPAISTADVDGIIVADIIVDAPTANAPVLVEVGGTTGSTITHAANPSQLDDVFIRIGGAEAGQAQTAIQIDANNAILDNIWSWRADHGTAATWTGNPAAHGLIVNGNNVLATGLAVEHYQQSQVVWNGNGGETIFYQSELPYDPPSQAAWMDGSARGYPAYEVTACTHTAYGLGVYSNFTAGPVIYDDNAITTPNATGINMTDMAAVFLSGTGGIANVINNTGGPAQNGASPTYLKSYIGNGTCPSKSTGTIAIDSGSTMAEGSFVADQFVVGGGSSTDYGRAITIPSTLSNPAPLAVYQSNRAGVMTYTIPGFANNSTGHTVRLHFAEIYFPMAGQRQFNVAVNGKPVLTNFDIVKIAGGENIANIQTFPGITANGSGQIVISFTNGAVNQPEVSGIDVQ